MDVFVSPSQWATLTVMPSLRAGVLSSRRSFQRLFRRNLDIKRRLNEHARDASKNFAREAYIIAGTGRSSELSSDSSTAEFLQFRLTDLAEQGSLVDVIKGVNPRIPDLSKDRRAMLEALVRHSLRLLFDAGCRAFCSNNTSQRRATADAELLGSDPAGPKGKPALKAPPVPAASLNLSTAICGRADSTTKAASWSWRVASAVFGPRERVGQDQG